MRRVDVSLGYRGRLVRLIGAATRIGLVGWVVGAAATWLLLSMAGGLHGPAGLAARLLGAGPDEAVTAFAASMGVPVGWEVPVFGFGGSVHPAGLVGDTPWLVGAVVVPLAAAVLIGWLAAKNAARYKTPAGWLLAGSAVGFGLVGWSAASLADGFTDRSLVSLSASPGWTLVFSVAWVMVGGWVGMALRRAVERRPGMAALRRHWVRGVAVLLVAAPLSAFPSAMAAADTCDMFPDRCVSPSPCSADRALSDPRPGLNPAGPTAGQVLDSLYHFRDFIDSRESPTLVQFGEEYWDHTGRMVDLMRADHRLLQRAAHALQSWQPAFAAVGEPAGDRFVITLAMVNEANALGDAFINADVRAIGGGALAATMRSERSRFDPNEFIGLTVNQALTYLEEHSA